MKQQKFQKKLIERVCVKCGVEDIIVKSGLMDVFEIRMTNAQSDKRQERKEERG